MARRPQFSGIHVDVLDRIMRPLPLVDFLAVRGTCRTTVHASGIATHTRRLAIVRRGDSMSAPPDMAWFRGAVECLPLVFTYEALRVAGAFPNATHLTLRLGGSVGRRNAASLRRVFRDRPGVVLALDFASVSPEAKVFRRLAAAAPALIFGRANTDPMRGGSSLAPLAGLKSLVLDDTAVESDAPGLGSQHYLSLGGCYNVADVSTLGGLHTLRLVSCTGVTDVSALGGLHTLNLRSARAVHDVSALGALHTLDITKTRVSDVTALGGLHTLMAGGTRLTDVTALGGLHRLALSGTAVTDLSGLGGLYRLEAGYCPAATGVASLGGLHTLNLYGTYVPGPLGYLASLSRLILNEDTAMDVTSLLGGSTLTLDWRP